VGGGVGCVPLLHRISPGQLSAASASPACWWAGWWRQSRWNRDCRGWWA